MLPRATTVLLVLAACGDDGLTIVPPPDASVRADAAEVDAVRTPPSPDALWFTDVTAAAGVGYVHFVPSEGTTCRIPIFQCEPERMAGGAAVADVDGDGWDDLYVTRLDGTDLLFRNLGDGTFEEVAADVGLTWDVQSNGVGFGDVDNDGDPDLYVTVIGEEEDFVNTRFYFFENRWPRFFEQGQGRGVDLGDSNRVHDGTSVAFGDYDRDGYLDLHVTEWAPRVRVREAHTRLFHNLGDERPGYFEDVTVAAGVELRGPGCPPDEDAICGVPAFGSAFTDLDRDGWPDLAVVADFNNSRLYWNEGDGTFSDGTEMSSVGTDETGMGSTFGDYDGDGDLDWFVSAISDPTGECGEGCIWSGNRLYRNEGDRRFTDVTDEAGVREGDWGWGTAFADFDNDGDLDLIMTNGVEFPAKATDEPFNEDILRYWENVGGRFVERAFDIGLEDRLAGKGLLVFDYDQDGDLDLFIANNVAGGRLFRNDVSGNGFLRVRLTGTTSTRDAVGAFVRIVDSTGRVQVREHGTGTHFLGQSERIDHFGLGPALGPIRELTVEWPSGETTELTDVEPNQVLHLVEPQG